MKSWIIGASASGRRHTSIESSLQNNMSLGEKGIHDIHACSWYELILCSSPPTTTKKKTQNPSIFKSIQNKSSTLEAPQIPPPSTPHLGFQQLCLRTAVVGYTTAIGHYVFFRCHTGVRFSLGFLD